MPFLNQYPDVRGDFTLLSPILFPKRGGGTDHLDPVKKRLIFLDYLSNQESMRQLSIQLGVSVSTIHGTIRRVNAPINENLANVSFCFMTGAWTLV